jgi:hypothetical protein
MTTRQKQRQWNGAVRSALAIFALSVLGPSLVARAQAPDPNAPVPAMPPAPTGDVPPAPPPPPEAPPPMPLPPVVEAAPPAPEPAHKAPQEKRKKDLEATVGMDPTQHDIGPEADMLGAVDLGVPRLKTKGWKYALHGYFRAPLRLGIGPHNDGTAGNDQWHSPGRVPGYNSNDWNYVGLTPNPGGSLYLNISNPQVSGNVILTTDTLNDASYDNLVKIGGIAQAYVTMKFPEVFGNKGGLAWTVGAFSNRYGTPGPRQESTGYYGTYLFGRTHVAGEALTADYDLTDHLELIVEHGFGAKLEVVPYVTYAHIPTPPLAPYLPVQGPVPQGSTFLHHAHISLLADDWLQISGHYLYSFTPDDLLNSTGGQPGTPRARPGSMTIVGGEVHVDGPKMGSGFLGYSHIDASKIFPLGGAVEVLHAQDGLGFKQNYFGPLNPRVDYYEAMPNAPHEDSGKIDTVMFQYLARLSPLLGRPRNSADVALGVFAMYNHIQGPTPATNQDRLKFGGDLDVTPLSFMAVGLRFDRVMPNGPNTELAYSALSPRLIFHTKWLSREYIVVSYSRYFYGSAVTAAGYTAPVTSTALIPTTIVAPPPDPNLVVVSALLSF